MAKGKRWSRIDGIGPGAGWDAFNAFQHPFPFCPSSGRLIQSGRPLQGGRFLYGMRRKVDLATLEPLYVQAARSTAWVQGAECRRTSHMARSRRKTHTQRLIDLTLSGAPRPVRRIASSRMGTRLILAALAGLLAKGVFSIEWKEGVPQLRVNQQAAKEAKQEWVDEFRDQTSQWGEFAGQAGQMIQDGFRSDSSGNRWSDSQTAPRDRFQQDYRETYGVGQGYSTPAGYYDPPASIPPASAPGFQNGRQPPPTGPWGQSQQPAYVPPVQNQGPYIPGYPNTGSLPPPASRW